MTLQSLSGGPEMKEHRCKAGEVCVCWRDAGAETKFTIRGTPVLRDADGMHWIPRDKIGRWQIVDELFLTFWTRDDGEWVGIREIVNALRDDAHELARLEDRAEEKRRKG